MYKYAKLYTYMSMYNMHASNTSYSWVHCISTCVYSIFQIAVSLEIFCFFFVLEKVEKNSRVDVVEWREYETWKEYRHRSYVFQWSYFILKVHLCRLGNVPVYICIYCVSGVYFQTSTWTVGKTTRKENTTTRPGIRNKNTWIFNPIWYCSGLAVNCMVYCLL